MTAVCAALIIRLSGGEWWVMGGRGGGGLSLIGGGGSGSGVDGGMVVLNVFLSFVLILWREEHAKKQIRPA